MAHIVTHQDTTRYAAFDSRWCAYDANHDLGQPIGKGATEAEAIEDLIRQMPEIEDADILTEEAP
jgi:hypothetical protein